MRPMRFLHFVLALEDLLLIDFEWHTLRGVRAYPFFRASKSRNTFPLYPLPNPLFLIPCSNYPSNDTAREVNSNDIDVVSFLRSSPSFEFDIKFHLLVSNSIDLRRFCFQRSKFFLSLSLPSFS